MSDLRKAALDALEALENFDRFRRIMTDGPDASDKLLAEDYAEAAFVKGNLTVPILRSALAEPQPEPIHDSGPWSANLNGRQIASDDFEHDVVLRVDGDFADDGQRFAYARGIVEKLNAKAQQPQTEPVARAIGDIRHDKLGHPFAVLSTAYDQFGDGWAAGTKIYAAPQAEPPQTEPVARIDPMQDPMRPSYFVAGAADEHPAEQVLRALACWLGVGGYNAPTVDAKVFHRKIVDGVEQLMKSCAAPQAEPAQTEPVFEVGFGWLCDPAMYGRGTKLYAAPQAQQPLSEPELAPWADFLGQPIRHGDLLTYPNGEEFVAVKVPGNHEATDAWRAVYEMGSTNRLCLQIGDKGRAVLAAAPQAQAQAHPQPLTEREIALLDGMIEVQLHHASQCDSIANRTMAVKQKGWDMERVALLRKLKGDIEP